jgi:uncharacterized protein YqhQ
MVKEKLPSYGGQALIEGVLMRGTNYAAAAFRSPDGQIVLHEEKLEGIYQSNIKKIPFLRGLILLWDALGLGMHFLTLSANIQTGEDQKIEGPALYGTLAVSLIFGISLFFIFPAFLGGLLETKMGISTWASNLLEGFLRLIIVIGYIWVVGKIPDIERVFAYHGAEHKTINAYEAGAELVPEVVKTYPLEHPRCGTSFLLSLVFLSILVFALLGPMPLFWRIISRILMLPVLTGMAYEYIRWTAGHLGSKLVRILIKPNLWLQGLTTRNPSSEMLEVAIASLRSILGKEYPGNIIQ